MRYIWFIFLISGGSLVNLQAQAPPTEVPSDIEKVVVFLDGAQIIRKAQHYMVAGKSSIVFREISPFVDKKSIQVKGEGDFTVLSVVHQDNFLLEQVKSKEIEDLEERLENLENKILLEKNYLEVYAQEEKMLVANQEIGGQNTGLNVSDLQAAVDFQRQRLTEVKLKKIECAQKIKTFAKDRLKIQKQLQARNAEKNLATSEILVELDNKKPLIAKFTISYSVSNAGWYPYYDLRVKDVSSPIQLIYRANVYQSCGEHWDKVKLTLSNANPNRSGIKPDLRNWYLSYNRPYRPQDVKRELAQSTLIAPRRPGEMLRGRIVDVYGEPLPGANVIIKGTSVGTVSDLNGNYYVDAPEGATLVIQYIGYKTLEYRVGSSAELNIKLEEDNTTLDEVVVVAYGLEGRTADVNTKDRKKAIPPAKPGRLDTERTSSPIPITENLNATSVSFDIDIPYTIPSDGKTYSVDIKTESLKAQYAYASVPKLEPEAFLTAGIVDWQDYNLLPGEASLFFEGTFLGKTVLDVSTLKDTLSVSLGRDQNVLVSRKRVEDFSRRQFIGGNKIETRAWKIKVRNRKKQKIQITLEDQLPLSKVKEITVEALVLSGARVDEETGKVTWTLELAPGAEKEFMFSYQVKYPKNRTLYLE